MLTLDKTDGTGLFIAVNTDEGGELVEHLTEAYYQSFVPEAKRVQHEPLMEPKDLSSNSGDFRINRLSQSNFEKLWGMFFEMSVTNIGNNQLEISSLGSRYTVTQNPGGYFSNDDDSRRIAFSKPNEQPIEALFFNSDPSMAFFRIQWYESRNVHLIIWLSSILVAVVFVIRFAYLNFNFSRRSNRVSAYLACNAGVSSLHLTFFVALVYTIVTESNRLFSGPTPLFQLASTALLLSIPVLVWAGWIVIREWSFSSASKNSFRIAVIVLQALLMISLNYWMLIGYQS